MALLEQSFGLRYSSYKSSAIGTATLLLSLSLSLSIYLSSERLP